MVLVQIQYLNAYLVTSPQASLSSSALTVPHRKQYMERVDT